jgi:hypothetical protein
MTHEEKIWALRDLLGMDVLLVPIPARQKGPKIKNWTQLTIKDMDRGSHLSQLVNHTNTGVLLGSASGGLCSIDIDIDDEVDRFLDYNPFLADTLQTRGERGANFWVRAGKSAPATTKLFLDGDPWGEWRGEGGLTVISGIHPCGKPYQFVHWVYPIEMDFQEIRWPSGVSKNRNPSADRGFSAKPGGAQGSPPLNSTALSEFLYVSGSSAPSLHSASLHDRGGSIALAIEAARAKQEFVSEYPHLVGFYDQWIGQRHVPKPAARNETLVTMVTFLAHCVAPEIVLLLALQFYDRNRAMWKDGRDQHEREALNHLKHVLARYPETLNADEAELYAFLDERTRTTFRIARDLASETAKETDDPTFFLSCENLGLRTGLDGKQADRILKELAALRVIEVVEKGTARKKGTKSKATTYRWRLSLKPRSAEAPATSEGPEPAAGGCPARETPPPPHP